MDLDADGLVDRVANTAYGLAWARNVSPIGQFPSFAALADLPGAGGAVLSRGENSSLATVIDMNGDGLPDIVSVGAEGLDVRFGELSTTGVHYVAGRFYGFSGLLFSDTQGLRDLNGDGVVDWWFKNTDGLQARLGYKPTSTLYGPYDWAFAPAIPWPSLGAGGVSVQRVGAALPGYSVAEAPSDGTTTSCDSSGDVYTTCYLQGALWDPRRIRSSRDVDGDGRLDVIERGSAADGTCPTDADCAMMAWWRTDSSLARSSAYEPAIDGTVRGICWSEFSFPEVHPSYAIGSCGCDYASPWPDELDYSTTWPGDSTLYAWEAGFVDLNGDGALDYASNRRLGAACGAPLDETWTIFTGEITPVLLRTVTLPSGAAYEVTYDLGATFGALPRDEMRWVATRLTLTGPRLPSASIQYWYKDPRGGQDWFDSHRYDPRGFAETWTYDDAGRMARHTVWETRSQVLKGSPQLSELGYVYSWTGNAPPTFTAFKRAVMSYAQRAKGGACSTPDQILTEGSYPALAVRTSQTVSEAVTAGGSFFTSATSIDCADVDQWGNIRRTKADPNTNTTGDEVYQHAVFDPDAVCKTCPVEIRTSTDPYGTYASQQLRRSILVYDSPPGTWNQPLAQGKAGSGRLNQVWQEVTSHLATGRLELAAATAYNVNGTVAFMVADPHVGAHARPVTESFNYDSAGLHVTSIRRTDGSTTLVRDLVYDDLGRLSVEYGPYVPGSAQAISQSAYAYDVFGRPIAAGRSIDAMQHVYEPVSATRYNDTLPPSIESYTFMAPRIDYEVGEIPLTPDVKLFVTHLDGLGRPIEIRERLGGVGTPLSAAQITQLLSSSVYRVASAVKFDAAGRMVAALEPHYSTSGAAYEGFDALATAGTRRASVTLYDSLGRVSCAKAGPWLAVNNANCASSLGDTASHVVATQFAYSAPGDGLVHAWAIPPKSVATTTTAGAYEVAYRGDGLLAWTTDAYGNRTSVEYDIVGRPVKVVRQAGSITASRQTFWKRYDSLGRVVEEFDDNWSPGLPRLTNGDTDIGSRQFEYDASGRVRVAKLAPVVFAGSTSTAPVARYRPEILYEYKSLGRPTRVFAREPSASSTAGGITWVTSERVAMTYDLPYAGSAAYGYTAGAVSSYATPVTTIALGYDRNGATIRRDQWFTGLSGAFSLTASIGSDGRLLSSTFTSPSGYAKQVAQVFRYDSAGRPVKLEASGIALWEPVTATGAIGGAYDPLGRVPTLKSNNGLVTTARTFSPYTGQLTAHVVDRSGVRSFRMDNILYAAGVIKSYQDLDTGTTYQYGYDSNARAVSASATTTSTTHSLRQSFTENYSFTNEAWGAGRTLGNLEAVTANSVRAKYDYRGDRVVQQRISGSPSYVYDHAGRLTRKLLSGTEVEGYSYDVEDRLKQIRDNGVVTQTLEYGPSGELMFRKVGTKVTYYVGGFATVTADVPLTCIGYGCTPVAGSVRVGVHASLGARVATIRAAPGTGSDLAGDVLYYHRDLRGSVVATTLSGGAAGVSYRYTPYGKLDKSVVNNANGESELGYTGGIRLTPDGRLLHLGARVYQSDVKRWLQPDTLDALRYTYVDGDPVNFVDPSGRMKKHWAQPAIFPSTRELSWMDFGAPNDSMFYGPTYVDAPPVPQANAEGENLRDEYPFSSVGLALNVREVDVAQDFPLIEFPEIPSRYETLPEIVVRTGFPPTARFAVAGVISEGASAIAQEVGKFAGGRRGGRRAPWIKVAGTVVGQVVLNVLYATAVAAGPVGWGVVAGYALVGALVNVGAGVLVEGPSYSVGQALVDGAIGAVGALLPGAMVASARIAAGSTILSAQVRAQVAWGSTLWSVPYNGSAGILQGAISP